MEEEDAEYVENPVGDLNVKNVSKVKDTGTQKEYHKNGIGGKNMDDGIGRNAYVGARIVECFCIAIFVFGMLWEGTEVLQLSFPEFMMLYGGTGAIISEGIARVLERRIKKKGK